MAKASFTLLHSNFTSGRLQIPPLSGGGGNVGMAGFAGFPVPKKNIMVLMVPQVWLTSGWEITSFDNNNINHNRGVPESMGHFD